MGLLDRYRQFEGMSEEEVNAELRAKAAQRKADALATLQVLDCSQLTWPHFPHPDVVAAITYAARRGINAAPDPRAGVLRRELAQRFALEPERIAIGDGAGPLLQALLGELLEPGDEVVVPWPSWPAGPVLARRARAGVVPVPGFDVAALRSAVTERTRVVLVSSPNDPTGERLPGAAVGALCDGLPERVVVVLDEALIEFAGDGGEGVPADTLELLDDHPRLLLLRSFSKAHALAGLRCGYALGGEGAIDLLARIEPPGGVSALAQAGAIEALRDGGRALAPRRALVARERRRLLDGLRALPVDVAPSEGNVLWIAARDRRGPDGEALRAGLERLGVIVRGGTTWGDDRHIRASIVDAVHSDRLLRALATVLGT